jgi:GT2 family glycosyltransferase
MSTQPPLISVIIPTFRRPTALLHCLEALTTQSLAKTDYEVIVVDDGTPEPHASEVATVIETAQLRGLPVRCLRQENCGPATARNKGASVARGRYLAFTDDDCAPEPEWLAVYLARLQDSPQELFGGYTVNALPRNPYATASQLLNDYLFFYFTRKNGQAPFFTSNNFAISATCFQEINGFDTSFPLSAAEDRDFCQRWQEAGRPLTFVREAVIQHAHTMGFSGYWRQHYRYGIGAFQFFQMRLVRGGEPRKREPGAFYVQLLLHPFVTHRRQPLYATCLVLQLFISQVATAAGYYTARAHASRETSSAKAETG